MDGFIGNYTVVTQSLKVSCFGNISRIRHIGNKVFDILYDSALVSIVGFDNKVPDVAVLLPSLLS